MSFHPENHFDFKEVVKMSKMRPFKHFMGSCQIYKHVDDWMASSTTGLKDYILETGLLKLNTLSN
ncbi:hypothetical protein YC2023_012130 [Brassica napus]